MFLLIIFINLLLPFSCLCYSFIMYLSDLPEMYTQAQGKGKGVHIRQITRTHDTADMCHAG